MQGDESGGSIEPPCENGNPLDELGGRRFVGGLRSKGKGWLVLSRLPAQPVLELGQSLLEGGHILRPGRWYRHVDVQPAWAAPATSAAASCHADRSGSTMRKHTARRAASLVVLAAMSSP